MGLCRRSLLLLALLATSTQGIFFGGGRSTDAMAPLGGGQALTCGQDRKRLGDWFVRHGTPDLLLAPAPEYVGPVVEDPYLNPNNPPNSPWGVCAMKWSNKIDPATGYLKYYLRNFKDEASARSSNFSVTHSGHCGACSYLQDLGVYLRQDLTDGTRFCAVLSIISPLLTRKCLLQVGFSLPCITIWEWNIFNSRKKCFQPCIMSFLTREPNNKADGRLNECLQCDEDQSIPNFTFFSGRLRRNSGLRSEIMRPSEQIYKMEHCYWY